MAHPRPAALSAGLLAALAGVVAARLGLAGALGVVADEAYYWTWSRQLAAGYYDHPPAVAWAIAPGAALLGPTALGVRLVPVLLGGVGLLVLLPLARDRALLLALLALVPLYALGGLFATPDVPLFVGWAVALAGAGRGGRGGWMLAGLGVGLAGLGKLTGYGLWPLLVLAAPREWRHWAPALALTVLIWSPNLLWNADHDWVSWRFQLEHGLGDATPVAPPGPAGLAAYVGAQAGLLSPVVFLAALAWAARGPGADRVDRLLWFTSVPAVLFFGFAATRAVAEPNWAAPAWIGALVGLARAGGRLERAGWVGAGLGGAMTALVVAHALHPFLPLRNDPVARLGEGEALAASVEAWGVAPVYTQRYQEAALITFHAGVEAWPLPGVDRLDHYDLGPVPPADHALYVRPHKRGEPASLDAVCDRRGPPHEVREGSRRWQVYEGWACDPAR